MRALWSVRVFGFDPVTKETLIDSCPMCSKPLGWTLTYGVAFCDHCYHPEEFQGAIWKYPGVDLRDFPQPLVEVNDVQALDFVTALIDPAPGRKESARRLVPEMWSGLSNGDTDLGRDDAEHAGFDDVRSVAMAIRKAAGDGLSNWLGPSLSSPLIANRPNLEAMISRGLAELQALHNALGVK